MVWVSPSPSFPKFPRKEFFVFPFLFNPPIHYNDCFPLVSMGSRHMAMKAAKNRAPEA